MFNFTKHKKSFLLCLLYFLCINSQYDCSAENQYDNKSSIVTIYTNVGLGTTGLDIGASVYYKNFIGIRGNYTFIPNSILSPLNQAIKNADNRITNAKSSFSAGGLDLSIRPFFGAFRIDVGMRFMNYNVNIDAYEVHYQVQLMKAATVFNTRFSIANGVKPYFGVGWDWNPFMGFTIGLDVGIIYTGTWSMQTINSHMEFHGIVTRVKERMKQEFQANDEEIKRNMKNNVNNKIPSFLKFWPVIKLSIGYRFNI